MTNKFRDVSNEIKNRKDCVGGNWDIIKQALTIAAELQDEAKTLRALDEAGDDATQGRICSNDGNPYSEDDYSNILTSECCCGEGRFKFLNDSIFLARAANARPAIKKLAQLVKEGE